MKMHKITGCAIDDASSPDGHSQLSCGVIAWSSGGFAEDPDQSAMMLTMISTPNWIAIRMFWMRS